MIPCYNSEETLPRAISSVFAQNGVEIGNVFLVDDGSGESQTQQLSALKVKYPKLEVILEKHTGHPGILREIGVSRCSSEWVAFLDSDDWWESNKLQIQLQFAQTYGFSAVSTNGRRWISEDRYVEFQELEGKHDLTLADLIRENFVICSSLIVRKELLNRISNYSINPNSKRAEDYATALRIASLGNIGYIDLELVNYKDYGNSFKSTSLADPRIYGWVDFVFWLMASKNRVDFGIKLRILLRIWKEYLVRV